MKKTNIFTTLIDNLEDANNIEQVADIREESEKFNNQVIDRSSDEDIRAMLDKVFILITDLDKYAILVELIGELKARINLRFLSIMFDAMVPMETRVWGNEGYPLDISPIYKECSDLLLDNYKKFAYNYNEKIIGAARELEYNKTQEGRDFIKRRTEIYSTYIVLAGEVIDPDIMSPFRDTTRAVVSNT